MPPFQFGCFSPLADSLIFCRVSRECFLPSIPLGEDWSLCPTLILRFDSSEWFFPSIPRACSFVLLYSPLGMVNFYLLRTLALWSGSGTLPCLSEPLVSPRLGRHAPSLWLRRSLRSPCMSHPLQEELQEVRCQRSDEEVVCRILAAHYPSYEPDHVDQDEHREDPCYHVYCFSHCELCSWFLILWASTLVSPCFHYRRQLAMCQMLNGDNFLWVNN